SNALPFFDTKNRGVGLVAKTCKIHHLVIPMGDFNFIRTVFDGKGVKTTKGYFGAIQRSAFLIGNGTTYVSSSFGIILTIGKNCEKKQAKCGEQSVKTNGHWRVLS